MPARPTDRRILQFRREARGNVSEIFLAVKMPATGERIPLVPRAAPREMQCSFD
jgi:hypothetical protein